DRDAGIVAPGLPDHPLHRTTITERREWVLTAVHAVQDRAVHRVASVAFLDDVLTRGDPGNAIVRAAVPVAGDQTTIGVALDLRDLLVAQADLVRNVVVPDSDHPVDGCGEDALDLVPDLPRLVHEGLEGALHTI